MLTSTKNVTMLLLDLLSLLAVKTANTHTAETESSMLSTENNAMKDMMETLISQLEDAQPDVPTTNVDMLTQEQLETSTELWLVTDVSTHTWDLPPDLLATLEFIGWLLKPFKRSLNIKLISSNTIMETHLRELNKDLANLKTNTHQENVCAGQPWVMLPLKQELPVHQSQENLLFKLLWTY
jgi:hypothetical protein